jgi:hypothetical protein
MKMNKIILQIVAVSHIILGIALPFLMKIEAFSNFMIEQIFPNISLSESAYSQVSYLIGVFGPTVASWGVLLLILINNFFESPSKQKWSGLFIAILIWFIGDTSFSLMHGISIALYLNGIVAISLLTPLYLSRNLFEK